MVESKGKVTDPMWCKSVSHLDDSVRMAESYDIIGGNKIRGEVGGGGGGG